MYDFNDEPLYRLYEFDGYYMINIRNTGSVLERGEGNSVYYVNKDDYKYYGGYEEYYIRDEGEYKNLRTGEVANKSICYKFIWCIRRIYLPCRVV